MVFHGQAWSEYLRFPPYPIPRATCARAGKTTLMDVIAGRKTVGEIGGTITVNGHKAEPRAWSRVMGCVRWDGGKGPTGLGEASRQNKTATMTGD